MNQLLMEPEEERKVKGKKVKKVVVKKEVKEPTLEGVRNSFLLN